MKIAVRRTDNHHMRLRITRYSPVFAVMVAAGVIGCGGGGSTSQIAIRESNVGSSAGSGNATTTGMTTGEITTGTTATVDPASGASTSGGPTLETTGATGGGGETGVVPSDPVPGNATSGGGTTVQPTTGGDEIGGGTDTTGSGSTGSSTTGGSTPPVVGPPPVSFLRSNAIYFGHWNDTGLISSVLDDGTGRVDEGGLNSEVVCAVPDPETANSYVYALVQNGECVLYRGKTFDATTSTRLLTDSFDAVTALQTTSDGDIAFVAIKDGESGVYLLSGGTAQKIDEASSCAVSRDGRTVAYTKIVDDLDTLYTWTRSTNTTVAIASGGDSLYPSFSKDGAWILFSSSRDGSGDTPFDLYQVPTGGGTVERITNTPSISEFGACYNEARTMISYAGFSVDDDEGGVYVRSNTGVRRIATDDDVRFATYWTDSQGRSWKSKIGGARFQKIAGRRRP